MRKISLLFARKAIVDDVVVMLMKQINLIYILELLIPNSYLIMLLLLLTEALAQLTDESSLSSVIAVSSH